MSLDFILSQLNLIGISHRFLLESIVFMSYLALHPEFHKNFSSLYNDLMKVKIKERFIMQFYPVHENDGLSCFLML